MKQHIPLLLLVVTLAGVGAHTITVHRLLREQQDLTDEAIAVASHWRREEHAARLAASPSPPPCPKGQKRDMIVTPPSITFTHCDGSPHIVMSSGDGIRFYAPKEVK